MAAASGMAETVTGTIALFQLPVPNSAPLFIPHAFVCAVTLGESARKQKNGIRNTKIGVAGEHNVFMLTGSFRGILNDRRGLSGKLIMPVALKIQPFVRKYKKIYLGRININEDFTTRLP